MELRDFKEMLEEMTASELLDNYKLALMDYKENYLNEAWRKNEGQAFFEIETEVHKRLERGSK